MKAEPLLKEKHILINARTNSLAIAELRIWKIPRTVHYPKGIKFSLFLVVDGCVLVGIDNHKPKGPHLHLGNREVTYDFESEAKLLEDFWDLARKAGYKP